MSSVNRIYWFVPYLALFFIFLALAIMVHHEVYYGTFFEEHDSHHGTWIVGCICMAIGIFVAYNFAMSSTKVRKVT